MEKLQPLASDPAGPPGGPGQYRHGSQLFTYCCFERERIGRVRHPDPVIGIILRGAKEFWLGDVGQRFEAGTIFVLPADREFTVVNFPDERSGIYEALLVMVTQVPPEIANMPPRWLVSTTGLDLRVRLTDELVDALVHAAISLAASEHATKLASHRLAEVLLLLRNAPAGRPLFEVSLSDRIAWLVLGDPARRWTAGEIGRALGCAASTLRRHLADQGTSLRRILASTRMTVACRVLASGEGNVSQAAVAAGYVSRSHFVRRFQSIHGEAPSAYRTRHRKGAPAGRVPPCCA